MHRAASVHGADAVMALMSRSDLAQCCLRRHCYTAPCIAHANVLTPDKAYQPERRSAAA